jgi:hypothetical protein
MNADVYFVNLIASDMNANAAATRAGASGVDAGEAALPASGFVAKQPMRGGFALILSRV